MGCKNKVKPRGVLSNFWASFLLYIIFDDNFAFAKNKLNDPKTLGYIENVVRDTLNRSFSIKIILKSESKNINLEIEKVEKDKGEQILEKVFPKEILDIKESINEIK
jgi:DNA polymerase-3 subunit gamma/tau